MREDAAEVIFDIAHDEAVEQRYAPTGASTCNDAASGQELEVFQGGIEARLPQLRLRLDGGKCYGDAAPAILDRDVDRRAVAELKAVFVRPYLA